MAPSIFVQIPACRDVDLLHTLEDAYRKASHPERVRFAVCWAYEPGLDDPMLPARALPKDVKMIAVPYEADKSACWAKHLLQGLYGGEDFTLMVGSNTRFVPEWDVKFINQLASCEAANPVLSSELPIMGKEPGLGGHTTYYIAPNSFDGAFPCYQTTPLEYVATQPLRGLFVAPTYYFAKGQIIDDIAIDPYLHTSNELTAFNLSLWCANYSVFTPTEHLLFQAANDIPTHSGTKSPDELIDREAVFDSLRDEADFRLTQVINAAKPEYGNARSYSERWDDTFVTTGCDSGDIQPYRSEDIEHYYFANKRSIHDFSRVSGIDFDRRNLDDHAVSGAFIYSLNPGLLAGGQRI